MINPELLEKAKARGTDADYQAWVRLWPSRFTDVYSEVVDGVGKCEFSHVRRVSAGAGIAIKPEYSGLPLTHKEHSTAHQKGEGIFCSPEWYEKEAARYLTMWINGVNPPEMQEQKRHWKKEYIVEHPGQMIAFWLLLQKHFSSDKAPAVKCTLQRAVRRRSNAQNNAQWGIIIQEAKKYFKDNPEELARMALEALRFDISDQFIHETFKLRFNKGKSTAGLSTIQSADYANDIRHHFLHEYQVQIPEPVKGGEYSEYNF